MKQEMVIFSAERNLQVLEIDAVNVAPEGLGYGDGGISTEARREDLGNETLQKIDELVKSPGILVPVSTDKEGKMLDDDGCGDGRFVVRIFHGVIEKTKSLFRAKVFGGGVTMAASTIIGLGRARGKELRQVFSDGVSSLRDKMINFGAHTDSHKINHPADCGCGAIDQAPTIVKNAVKFQSQIRQSITDLGIDLTGLDEVEAEFEDFASGNLGEYTGKSVMNEIVDNGKVVKELDDDHKEVVIILNMVEGYTVDQEKIRAISNGKAQAFAVDVWRVKAIADRLYADESEIVRHKAFLSELVYTLATAATLTAGDLPVYVVNKQPELVAA